MKYEEVEQQAAKLAKPQINRLKSKFANEAMGLHRLKDDVKRDDRAQEIALPFIQRQLELIAGGMRQVIEAGKIGLAESDIRKMYNELCPSLWDIKQDVYKWYQGVIWSTARLDGEIDRVYEETKQCE